MSAADRPAEGTCTGCGWTAHGGAGGVTDSAAGHARDHGHRVRVTVTRSGPPDRPRTLPALCADPARPARHLLAHNGPSVPRAAATQAAEPGSARPDPDHDDDGGTAPPATDRRWPA